ncbi:ABC transporter ATP-binding protein [Dysgonomonas massiliensis]|uniref:ABC transporter ATP-binding protein n=1 Tax=Dysgonomonas massiliensis TaxID=2040292 RepID=UPI000C76F169|nr:ABC transporter ATP-binding protein [Dysgonomonas massiliensis]
MVKIENLSFAYKKKNLIFDNVSFEMKSGIYGLLGENGVGKSTLLHIISGLRFATSGTCKVHEYDSYKRQPQMLEKLFFLPEEFDAPAMSPNKFAKVNSVFYPNFSDEQFQSYLKEFNVDPNQKMTEMSLGQRKKSMISFTLAVNTPLTLLDEPTNGLDIPSKAIFRRLLASVADKEKCIIVSTHQVRDLENIIDPIIILDRNEVLVNNSVEEITAKLKFNCTSAPLPNALYSEPTMQGHISVTPNFDNEESTINIEALFNAAVRDKAQFKELFNI